MAIMPHPRIIFKGWSRTCRRGNRGEVQHTLRFVLLGLLVSLSHRTARAYTIETQVTHGCHEEVTEAIIRETRASLPKSAASLAETKDDRALMNDVAFTVPGDLHDIAAVTLILGVRDNDVKEFAAVAIDQLAALNADPEGQKLHCLRRSTQDEPTGSAEAVDDCRAFIRETLLSAVDALDVHGLPDASKRDALQVTLAIRGRTTVDVPAFYLRAGRAIHAIEDSFTHTFRSVADRHKITVVLNWTDYANKSLDESRDGPAHTAELDRCDDPDALRTERRHLAIEAGTAALAVILDPTTDRATKAKGIETMLDNYIVYDKAAHCTFDNHWCDAPELAYENTGCGCTAAGSGTHLGSVSAFLAGLAGLVAWSRRAHGRKRTAARRPRPRGTLPRSAAIAAALVLGLSLVPLSAHAETPARPANRPGTGGPIDALEGKSNSGAPNTKDTPGAFFARVQLGASYDKPGLAGGLGVRYQLSKPLMLGFDAEVNPYIATSPTRYRWGSFNAYASIIRRFQLKNDSLNVRSQLGLGVSMLLIDLVGAPAGSYGPFFGLSFLGVEWKIARGFYLTIDPTYIAIPVPHLTGAPFGYLQYRFLVGLEFGG